jgi:hypothetical protein
MTGPWWRSSGLSTCVRRHGRRSTGAEVYCHVATITPFARSRSCKRSSVKSDVDQHREHSHEHDSHHHNSSGGYYRCCFNRRRLPGLRQFLIGPAIHDCQDGLCCHRRHAVRPCAQMIGRQRSFGCWRWACINHLLPHFQFGCGGARHRRLRIQQIVLVGWRNVSGCRLRGSRRRPMQQ